VAERAALTDLRISPGGHVHCSETLVTAYKNTRRYNTENNNRRYYFLNFGLCPSSPCLKLQRLEGWLFPRPQVQNLKSSNTAPSSKTFGDEQSTYFPNLEHLILKIAIG
jgi:hypothetical protein